MTSDKHAELSANRFGGKAEDYISIHNLMDSSKSAFADLRHRTLTHHSWFVTSILPLIFGDTVVNSDGQKVSVKDIGHWHVLEDFQGSDPTVQDYLMNMKFKLWMDNGTNGAKPPSNHGLPAFDKSLLHPKPQLTSSPLQKILKKPVLDFPDPFPTKRDCGGGGRLD